MVTRSTWGTKKLWLQAPCWFPEWRISRHPLPSPGHLLPSFWGELLKKSAEEVESYIFQHCALHKQGQFFNASDCQNVCPFLRFCVHDGTCSSYWLPTAGGGGGEFWGVVFKTYIMSFLQHFTILHLLPSFWCELLRKSADEAESYIFSTVLYTNKDNFLMLAALDWQNGWGCVFIPANLVKNPLQPPAGGGEVWGIIFKT